MLRRSTPQAVPPEQKSLHQRLLRPPDRTRSQKVRDFIWDKKNKTCLTRTPINWLSITVYYLIFVSVVILILYISMLIAYKVASRNSNRPQYILGDSPIGTTPTLNFFPMYKEYPLIWLSSSRSYQSYIDKINKMLNGQEGLGQCGKAPFGYDKKLPCIFFRLNRLIMWKPEPYQKGDTLPEDIPKTVKEMISNSSTPMVWISCEGTMPKDRDHLTPEFFQLQGTKGFNPSAYPYDRQPNFVDPIVAMKLVDKNQTRILYQFTCYAWAKKIDRKKTAVDVTYYFE